MRNRPYPVLKCSSAREIRPNHRTLRGKLEMTKLLFATLALCALSARSETLTDAPRLRPALLKSRRAVGRPAIATAEGRQPQLPAARELRGGSRMNVPRELQLVIGAAGIFFSFSIFAVLQACRLVAFSAATHTSLSPASRVRLAGGRVQEGVRRRVLCLYVPRAGDRARRQRAHRLPRQPRPRPIGADGRRDARPGTSALQETASPPEDACPVGRLPSARPPRPHVWPRRDGRCPSHALSPHSPAPLPLRRADRPFRARRGPEMSRDELG